MNTPPSYDQDKMMLITGERWHAFVDEDCLMQMMRCTGEGCPSCQLPGLHVPSTVTKIDHAEHTVTFDVLPPRPQ